MPAVVEVELPGHASAVVDVRMLGAGRAASGDAEGQLRIWNTGTGALVSVHRAHFGSVSAMTVDRQGRLWTGGVDGRVLSWSADGSQAQTAWTLTHGPVRALAAGPGFVVASDGADLWLRTDDGRTAQLPFARPGAIVTAMTLDDSGSRLALGLALADTDPRVLVGADSSACPRARSARPLVELGPRAPVDEIRVLDAASGETLHAVDTPGAHARLSLVGDRVVTLDAGRVVEWDVVSGERSLVAWTTASPLSTGRRDLSEADLASDYVRTDDGIVVVPIPDPPLIASAVGPRAVIASDGRDLVFGDGLGDVGFAALAGSPGSWTTAPACVSDHSLAAATTSPWLAAAWTDGAARSWIRLWNWREGSVATHELLTGDVAAKRVGQLDLDDDGRWLAWTLDDRSWREDRLQIDNLLGGESVLLRGHDPAGMFSRVALFAFRPHSDVLVALTSDAASEADARVW